jgi:hypothetical protein
MKDPMLQRLADPRRSACALRSGSIDNSAFLPACSREFAPGLLLVALGLGVMLTPSVNLVKSEFAGS